jgi:hypothetical protein
MVLNFLNILTFLKSQKPATFFPVSMPSVRIKRTVHEDSNGIDPMIVPVLEEIQEVRFMKSFQMYVILLSISVTQQLKMAYCNQK